MQTAKLDPKIKGIYLAANHPGGGWAVTEEIRSALADFRKSGKFVYSYGETYSESGYYLSSVADKIYVNPAGGVDFNGLSAEYEFYKGTLDKPGYPAGRLPRRQLQKRRGALHSRKHERRKPETNRLLLHSIYDQVLTDISDSRKVPVARLKTIADSLLADEPADALRNKLVTNVGYYDEFDADMRKALKVDKDAKLQVVPLDSYLKAPKQIRAPIQITKLLLSLPKARS